MNEQKFSEVLSNIEKMNCSDNYKKYLINLITEFNDIVDYETWVDDDDNDELLTEYVKFCYAHYRHHQSAYNNIGVVIDMLRDVNLQYMAFRLRSVLQDFDVD